jgi:hypothetical protein
MPTIEFRPNLRHHVKILIEGRHIRGRDKLSDTLEPSSRIHVFQAQPED